MYEHQTLGLRVSQYDMTFDLKINASHFALYLEDYLMYEHQTLGLRVSQYDMTFDLKINVSHCDLYFMVQ